MKNLTTEQKIQKAVDKSLKLVFEISRFKHGRDNYEDIIEIVKDIYKDELELIEVIDEYEIEKEFPNF